MSFDDSDIRDFFKAAYKFAKETSDDPITHVGAVVVSVDLMASIGSNHFPLGVAATKDRTDRPQIHDYIMHGEETSIIAAARAGVPTAGATMFGPWAACRRCARQIIESGIVRLIRHKEMMDRTPDRWIADIRAADGMMREAGVEIIDWSGRVGGVTHLINGEVWKP